MMQALLTSLYLLLPVLFGGIFVHYLKQSNKDQFIKLALAFSGGFLLAIACLHLLPDLYSAEDAGLGIGMYILFGFLVQLILEFFSGGIEHGHVHVHKGQAMPWGLFLSLSVHSIIEGIPLGNQIAGLHAEVGGHHHGTDDTLLFGIIFHQFPVAVALMTLLLQTSIKQSSSWIYLLLFGIMTPLGLLVGLYMPAAQIGVDYHMILAIVVGMFLHISTTIIFETAENHTFHLFKLLAILSGCFLAFLVIP
jgi:zinc transporter ZupT